MPQKKKQNLIDDAVERRRRRVERMTDQEREQFRLKFNQDARRRYQATYKVRIHHSMNLFCEIMD